MRKGNRCFWLLTAALYSRKFAWWVQQRTGREKKKKQQQQPPSSETKLWAWRPNAMGPGVAQMDEHIAHVQSPDFISQHPLDSAPLLSMALVSLELYPL